MNIKFCPYRIIRDQDNSPCFFVVNVPEAGQLGVGFQINITKGLEGQGILYGLSVYNQSLSKGERQNDSTNKFGLKRL